LGNGIQLCENQVAGTYMYCNGPNKGQNLVNFRRAFFSWILWYFTYMYILGTCTSLGHGLWILHIKKIHPKMPH